LAAANKVTAPMYIANPFKRKGQRKLADLTSTHPPISERVRILRNMSQGASFKDYSNAYTNITKGKNIIPAAALTTEDIRIRQAQAQAEPKPTKARRTQDQLRQVGDIMRKVNGFLFLTCVCGLKLKVPPNFKADTVKCPRCSHALDVAAQRRVKNA
jgi:heat shock protein HtpX